jgi:hypothetical protein
MRHTKIAATLFESLADLLFDDGMKHKTRICRHSGKNLVDLSPFSDHVPQMPLRLHVLQLSHNGTSEQFGDLARSIGNQMKVKRLGHELASNRGGDNMGAIGVGDQRPDFSPDYPTKRPQLHCLFKT